MRDGKDITIPTHISLFVKKVDGEIYFVDSTKKDAVGDAAAVDGVSLRHYPENDPHFLSFGIMLLNN
jgi:hypothetical protein